MEDFASALVVAMVRRSLARQSQVVPASTVVGDRSVSPAEKRALLDGALGVYGPDAILRVADIVPEFADHPVAGVFTRCRTPSDVVASWIAIERYFHSRHRTRAVLGFGSADLPAEPAAPTDQTYRWTITWQEFIPSPNASSAWDEESPVPAVDFVGRAISDPCVARLFAEQLGAPTRRRGAAEIARAVGLSQRTLQRRLGEVGWTLGDIVVSARVHLATRLLASTDTPLALVGLLAGYSDQPHFQRKFRAAVGPTPAEYRRLIARRGSNRPSA